MSLISDLRALSKLTRILVSFDTAGACIARKWWSCVLKGESLDLLARETGQPAGWIGGWREDFLADGGESLKSHPAPIEDVAWREAQRNVGELSIEVDILDALLERKGRPQSPRRSK